MTVPMQELVIVNPVRPAARAGRAMIHLDDLLYGQEDQSTPGAASILDFQQPADPPWDFGMCLETLGPIQQAPIVGARGALDFGVPLDRDPRVIGELGAGLAVFEDPIAWGDRPPIEGS